MLVFKDTVHEELFNKIKGSKKFFLFDIIKKIFY